MERGERRTSNLASTGNAHCKTVDTHRAIFPWRRRLRSANPQPGLTNTCEDGAVTYVLGIQVTAQVLLTRIRRLQPGILRLQQRHPRLASVQRPRLAYVLLTRARRNGEQFA
jgi:hypothetical protein